MKHLINFKHYINESMKNIKDLNTNIGMFINNINEIILYDLEDDKVYGYISLSKDVEGWFYFTSVAAEPGYGPLILEMALMFCYDKGGLMVVRDGDIRGGAFNVWKKFYHRNDVVKKTLPFNNDKFNFAIITGDEYYESDGINKESEYDYHIEDGFKEDIIIYNTIMSIKPTNSFNKFKNKYINDDIDIDEISYRGQDFFSYRYNE